MFVTHAQMARLLAAALNAGRAQILLPPLLVAGYLVHRGNWGKEQYRAMLEPAVAICQQGHAGEGVTLVHPVPHRTIAVSIPV